MGEEVSSGLESICGEGRFGEAVRDFEGGDVQVSVSSGEGVGIDSNEGIMRFVGDDVGPCDTVGFRLARTDG